MSEGHVNESGRIGISRFIAKTSARDDVPGESGTGTVDRVQLGSVAGLDRCDEFDNVIDVAAVFERDGVNYPAREEPSDVAPDLDRRRDSESASVKEDARDPANISYDESTRECALKRFT